MAKKTDNARPGAKLALRRHFLKRYHQLTDITGFFTALLTTDADVLDCCQAKGKLWTAIRRDTIIADYWGVDIQPKKGRLKIDSARILGQPGWRQNVVDIDTYGSPWSHWLALLEHCHHAVTVFLTIGNVRSFGGGTVPIEMRKALGIDRIKQQIPRGFTPRLLALGTESLLALALDRFTIVEAREAPPGPNARYIGLRLEPR